MDRGTYAAASSGLANLRKLEIVNNNLANVSTPGFKGQVLVTKEREFEDTLAAAVTQNSPLARGDHERVSGSTSFQAMTDFRQGAIETTSNPLDAALRNPNHFFVVQGPNGIQYTRAGNFTLNGAGQLTTSDGAIVQGDGGAIESTLPNMKITPSGDVTAGGQRIGKLQTVQIDDLAKLERTEGASFVLKGGAATPVEPNIVAGALERSNVSTITSMVDLITTSRGFELYTRIAQSIDQMNTTAISQVGKSRT